ncbi:unnamed protein product [Pleuronectes platessa]|uniref:Inward rectifier potassium channel C-terminal domain-containing protein n=1 Tax=Pleuronectes platessa TaxID=8262 RepID=A0A9N7YTN1_PLEPL|nr:unnamed protein product [Pleuronectes platessa]
MSHCLLSGAFVAKIARPQKRAGAIQFSPQAVVGQHQGQMCLMLRATNLLQQPLVDVKVSAVLYEEHEGQALHQTSLDFLLDHMGQQPCPFFIFPLTFYHPLDRQSPLYPTLCEGTSNNFELVVFLSALQEGTGDSCQKRTSYLRQEIQFDRCFVPALGMDARGRYMVLLVPLDDPAKAHQGAHLHSSPSGYIYPGCAPSHRQFVRVTTLDPVILLTCFSYPMMISRSHQQSRQPALLLFLPADNLPELSAIPSSCIVPRSINTLECTTFVLCVLPPLWGPSTRPE